MRAEIEASPWGDFHNNTGAPEASLIAQLVKKNPPEIWETWVGKIPWRREKLPTLVFWPGEFHGLGVTKSQTRLIDFHFHFQGCPGTKIRSARFVLFLPWQPWSSRGH